MEFVSSLAVAVEVEAVVENVPDTSIVCIQVCFVEVVTMCGASLAVQVVFPDGKLLTFRPKASEFKELSENRHRLRTSVILSHDNWSGKTACCCVLVTVNLKALVL